MFNPSRDQARRFFIDAWHKHLNPVAASTVATPLSPLEDIAVDLIEQHPEYHELLADPDAALARDWTPEAGQLNPFLHLSLHLAIEEQIAIDQPPGLRALFEKLKARRPDRHAALHDVLECLGEIVWTAQRSGMPPDGAAYLECVRKRM
ncbi:MAG: DUF1841 family protein [Rhodocyclaceae bacterium]|nr:DUF1841 family protein [Rhodocyclaceae bacterium]